DIDDGTSAPFDHMWEHGLAAPEGTVKIDCHHPLPRLFIGVQSSTKGQDASSIEQDVDPTVGVKSAFDHELNLQWFGDIHWDKERFTSGALNRLSHLFSGVRLEVSHSHFGSFSGKQFGCGPSDTRACARNNRNFVRKSHLSKRSAFGRDDNSCLPNAGKLMWEADSVRRRKLSRLVTAARRASPTFNNFLAWGQEIPP